MAKLEDGVTISDQGLKPEQLLISEAVAIDSEITGARVSIRESLMRLGMMYQCEPLATFLFDKKYEIPVEVGRAEVNMEYTRWTSEGSKVDADKLPWPLNMQRSWLLVGYCIRRGELSLGWIGEGTERKVSLILGDDARTVLAKVDRRSAGAQHHSDGDCESFYRGGRIIRSAYVEKEVKRPVISDFVPSGFLGRLAALPESGFTHREIVHEETSTIPTLAEFRQTEEWGVISKVEASLRAAVYNPKGSAPTKRHFPHPHRHAV